MRNALLWFVCSITLFSHSFTYAQSSVDGMTLLGMAEFSELRRPYYIGALYADTPTTDAALLLETQGRRRMEMRVTAETWGMRRFSSQWTQSIFVNNPQSELLRFDDAFLQFNSLLNRPFVRGDIITVDGFEDGSTVVSVNGIEAMTIYTPGFTQLLLSKWIGSKPPTTEFRTSMLSNNNDVDLSTRFSLLEPTGDRIASIKSWFAGGIAGVRLDDEADEAAAESEVAAVLAPEPEVAEEPEVKPEAKPEVAAVAVPKPKPVIKVKPLPEPEPEEEEIDAEAYAKQQEILTFLYQNSVVKRILQNVKYPARALDRDQQDRIQVAVEVDRKGNVTDVSFVVESKYGLLNNAAEKAIEKTGKMPPVPAGLDGESVRVLVPFAFILG